MVVLMSRQPTISIELANFLLREIFIDTPTIEECSFDLACSRSL